MLSTKILSYLLVIIIANFLYHWLLNFMVFLPYFCNVSLLIEGVGGIGSGVEWDEVGWEVAKTPG